MPLTSLKIKGILCYQNHPYDFNLFDKHKLRATNITINIHSGKVDTT
jgi:hypothetical protein